MKRRKIITVIIILIIASVYIWISTTYINKGNYSRRAYDQVYKNRPSSTTKAAKVTLVKLKDEPCTTPPGLVYKLNRYLLFLNGGHAVRVEINTDMDGLLGPIIVYYNPFTKQPVGSVLRM